jgi:hypothetical protein
LEFNSIIGKVIKGLNDENFEHQNDIIIFRPGLLFVFSFQICSSVGRNCSQSINLSS